jgi:hypothetical protein
MPSLAKSGLQVRTFEVGDLPVVSRRLAAALTTLDWSSARLHDLEFDPGLGLDSIAERTWILWRGETPLALLPLNATSRLGGGFERTTWLSAALPPESGPIHVLLGSGNAVQCTVAEFCRNHGIQWRQPATVSRSAGTDAVRAATHAATSG